MKKQMDLPDQHGVIKSGQLNEVIHKETIRPDGSRRIQQDFEFCPTMAEQHTAHLSNINYLMEKYKPDELAAYISARNQYRQEIVGHDFSKEPNLQSAKNIVLHSKKAFEELPEDIKNHFPTHLEFLKFIDNPHNANKLIKLGLATKREIENIQIPELNTTTSTTTQPNPHQTTPIDNNNNQKQTPK